jgi:glutathione S-transferase
VKQLMKTVELYVEGPIHPLVGVIFGREIPAYVKESCPAQARRGLGALGRLARFSPYLCGSQLTAADIFTFYSLTLCNRLTKEVYGWNIMEEVPGLTQWYAMMSEREVTRQVLAEMDEAADSLAARQAGKQAKK